MLLAPIRSFRVCISHQSERRFCSLVWEVFNFNEVMGDSVRAVRKTKSSFRMRNVGFIALLEKCDTTGQMKDIRLPIRLLMLWKWWIVVWERMEFSALYHDHGYCCFTTRASGKMLIQIFLEVLMNCTKHFDLSSSLTASFVAIFMICWVCRLYFSGLVCSVLSLDECLIKINYGRFCVCFRCLEKVILWSRLCLAKDEFSYHR